MLGELNEVRDSMALTAILAVSDQVFVSLSDIRRGETTLPSTGQQPVSGDSPQGQVV